MAYTKFTGTPEEFKRLQREQGLALKGQDAVAYDAAQSSIANTGMDQRSRAQAMAAQDDLRQLEEKGRRNYESVQAHSAAENGRALERQRQAEESDRRAALSESWKGNPARSWDEVADRYNSLNITSKASEWAETARQRQAVADAAAKDTRDRHMRWSAGAMTALTRANDPDDKDAQGQLSVALEDIGNSLAREQGLVFDAKKGIQTRRVNGELEATLTWTTEDGQTVTKTFSPSSLRKAYKGEALDTVLRTHWADMVEKDRKRFEGSAKDQADAALAYAKAAEIAQRVGLDASKQEFEQMCIMNGIPVPDGKGGYSIPGGGGARSGGGQAPAAGQDFYGYGDYGKLQQAALNEAKELFSAAAASGNPITWAEAKKQALDGLKSDYEGRFGGNSSGANGAGAPVVENAISAVDEFAGDGAPRGGASPSVPEKKKSEDVPPVAPGEAAKDFMAKSGLDGNGSVKNPINKEQAKKYLTILVNARNGIADEANINVGAYRYGGDGSFGRMNKLLFGQNSSSIIVNRNDLDNAISLLEEVVNGTEQSAGPGGEQPAGENPSEAPAQDGSDAGGEEPEGLTSEDIDAAVSESSAAGSDATSTASGAEETAKTAESNRDEIMSDVMEMRRHREEANAAANKKTKDAEAHTQARMKSVERDEDFSKQYGRTPAELKNEIFEVLYNGADLLAPLSQETVDAQLQKPSNRELLGLDHNRQFDLQERQLADVDRAGENVILRPALRDDGTEVPGVKKIVLNKVNKRTALHNGKVFEIETRNGEQERDRLEDLIAPAMLGGDAGYQETDDAYVFFVNEDLFNDLHNLQKERHKKWWDSQPENRGETLKERKAARGKQALRRQIVNK